jgi:hypothetical protein
MNKTFNLLFFIKKSKIKANGTAPIYLRITIDGAPKEIASKRYIQPDKWDNKLQKVSGASDEVKSRNKYLKKLEQEVYDAHHSVIKDKTTATASILKAKLQGTEQRAKILAPIFQYHNNKLETLVVQKFTPETLTHHILRCKLI